MRFVAIFSRVIGAVAALSVAVAVTAADAQQVPTIIPPAPEFAPPSAPVPRVAPPGAPRVSEIVVEGTQRIEPETVRSYMVIREGDVFDVDRVNQSLKALFATGLFADATLTREGDSLIVRVVENPIINRIAFEGNKRLEEEVLRSETNLRPRVVYTRTRVQADVKRLLDLYRRTGRFAATVEPKVIQLPQNRVDLVFEINEGEMTGIRRISFVGNRAFSDSSLREVVQTSESRWYKFLSQDDTYDPDRLTFDRELLRRHYLKSGYADFRVVSAVAELTPDRDDFFITFTLDEGERYKFGKVDIESKIAEVDAAALQAAVEVEAGDWYDAEAVDDTIIALTDAVGEQGFAFVEVRPNVRRDRDKRIIDITFEIQEGPRVFVERIEILGNVRTLDEVIRREFRLVEGDAFNSAQLRRSRTRIQNLAFFSRVDINTLPGSTPDRTVIEVEVAEQSTGELSVGAGFSSSIGALADIGIRERNLLGRGQDLRMNLTLAQRRQQIDVGFTEPYFLDRELAAGVDVFHTESTTVSEFRNVTTGAGVRLGYELTERWRQRVRYTLRRDQITDVSTSASRFIQAEVGDNIVSIVGQDLIYDTRDSRITPTEGFFAELSNDVAGLGGDLAFLRNRLQLSYYYPLFPGWIASAKGQVGFVFGIGDDDIRINDRFFLGGENLRGFESGGAGPRDISADDALGGKQLYAGSLELTFPLGLPKEFGVSGAVFTDVGTVTGLDFEAFDVIDDASLRASVGAGVAWRSPFGPIRIDFAIPLLKEEFDDTELVRFNFGTRF